MNLKEIVKKELLNEQGRKRDVIRKVIKDIVNVYKNEDEGEYYLPEYFEDRDEMVYDFMTMGESFIVELILEINDEIKDFRVNAEVYNDDHLIKLVVQYNSEMKERILYDLIGELNEVIAHELRHITQDIRGTFVSKSYRGKDPVKYYTQPKELDAQVFGFNRLSKLTRTPFEEVVSRWFETHRDIHQLDDKGIKTVISKLLQFRRDGMI
jgi:uncharacterized membrane protein YheB (UPF0754 family)